MVESTGASEQGILDVKLTTEWAKMAKAQEQTKTFVEQSIQKEVQSESGAASLGFVAFFNQKLDINRLILAEGTGSDQMPKVEFGGGGQDDSKDPFEDSLEDALCVFKSGAGAGKDTDILKENEAQLLFYVDLDNESVIDKSAVNPDEGNAQEDEDEDIVNSKHPVLLNQYPICQGHSLFLLFAQEGLPQVLSDELLILLLQIFKLSGNPSLRVGYNSMGADCIANNLHFHVLYADKIFPDSQQFPIEVAEKALFFRSNLQHKSSEEINMYQCGVRFGEVLGGWPVHTLLLSPDIAPDSDTSLEDAQEALAHAAGVVLNHLIDKNIPHNLLIADEGMTIYIIPRKFDLLIEGVTFFTSFESLCGVVKCKTEAGYKTIKQDELSKRLQSAVSLKDSEFTALKKEIMQKFLTEYDGEEVV